MRVAKAFGHAAVGLVVASGISLSAAQSQGVLGTTRHALDARHASLCSGETAYGNVVANAMKEAGRADIAIINCAAFQTDVTFAAGSELTREGAAKAFPTDKVAVVELTGAQLLALLENAFSALGQDDGRFPQVAGLRIDVKARNPVGQRVVRVTVNGGALDFNRDYRIATTDTLLAGAMGYSGFASGKTQVTASAQPTVAGALASYVEAEGVVDVKVWGRIEFID